MKVLGTDQFSKKKFKLLEFEHKEFKGILGDIPKNFIMVIFGDSGNGKTEFCIQLAKFLTSFGKVAWLSYEQGHGYDLQKATTRNNMNEVSGKFYIIDPSENLPAGVTFFQDLDKYLNRRNSPDFIFIDSIDYTQFTWEDYVYLKNKYGKRKTFIFISHADGNKPKKSISKNIHYDGHIGIYVHKFIAYPSKNRFGGIEDYVIYDKRARELNPIYFQKRANNADLFNPKAEKQNEAGGVNADLGGAIVTETPIKEPEKAILPPMDNTELVLQVGENSTYPSHLN